MKKSKKYRLDLPVQRQITIPVPSLSYVARKILSNSGYTNKSYIENSETAKGALLAVDRIMKYGRTESNELLVDTKWFRQQLRLTADNRLHHVLTTGASQVSKSLANYLVCVDDLINGHINIGWFYASRMTMFNQQPEQFQSILKYWVANMENPPDIERNSTARVNIGGYAIGNFTYVNSDSEEKHGGASEGKETASFSASKIYLEERSSYKANVDVTPRLGASKLISKPIRDLGTPGGGGGIEKHMKECLHYFSPGVICDNCNLLTWLEPKGALLKPKKNSKTGKLQYFGVRGEILDFYSADGTPKTAYIACVNCGEPLPPEKLNECELYSRQTKQSADGFLDTLEQKVLFESIGIYLSPLLRCSSDPFRLQEIITDGLDPLNPLIFCQNKLGYPSEMFASGVNLETYDYVLNLAPHCLTGKTIRVAGIDQNRGMHHIVIAEMSLLDLDAINIIHIGMISQSEIKGTLENWQVDYGLIDNEPDRLDTNRIAQQMGGRLELADQRDMMDDIKNGEVRHGDEVISCYFINNALFIDQVCNGFNEEVYRIGCVPHRSFKRHICSLRKDDDTGKWLRPPDHEDHFYYSMVFLQAAISVYRKRKRNSTSSIVGVPLKKTKNW